MKIRIKKTYICAGINDYIIDQTLTPGYKPQVGDVGIFEVIKIGKHKVVQSETKRNATIVPGDWFMAAFGNRYATAQFEGYLPENCEGELHILGAGGIVGIVKTMHYNYVDIGPTTLRFIGLVKNNFGETINTKAHHYQKLSTFTGAAPSATNIILSVGSAMDSGKTTTAAYLVHGLKKAGYTVAYVKLTGTAYTKDCDFNYDLGADVTADFSDFGFPSTYLCEEDELLDLYESLIQKIISCSPDFTLVEIADGLYQRETKMLLANNQFKETLYSVIFSAGDSLSAISGKNVLDSLGLSPFVLSGLFTASPLLIEEVKNNMTVPVLTIDELSDKGVEVLNDHIKNLSGNKSQKLKVR